MAFDDFGSRLGQENGDDHNRDDGLLPASGVTESTYEHAATFTQ